MTYVLKATGVLLSISLHMSAVFATEGGVGHGGANGVGYELLDLVQSKNAVIKTTEEVIAERPLLQKALLATDKEIFSFSENISDLKKKWIFTKKFNPQSVFCKNATIMKLGDGKIVACQLPTDFIFIDDEWLNNENVSETTRSATIFHELLVGQAQAAGNYKEEDKKFITETYIHILTGNMFKQGYLAATDIKDLAQITTFKYMSAQDALIKIAEVKKSIASLCQEDISTAKTNKLIGKSYELFEILSLAGDAFSRNGIVANLRNDAYLLLLRMENAQLSNKNENRVKLAESFKKICTTEYFQ